MIVTCLVFIKLFFIRCPSRPFLLLTLYQTRCSSNLSISATHSRRHPATDWRGTFYIPTRLSRVSYWSLRSQRGLGHERQNGNSGVNDSSLQLFSGLSGKAMESGLLFADGYNLQPPGRILDSTLLDTSASPPFRGCTSGRAYRNCNLMLS